MSKKQDLIKEMLEMQKKFIAHEHAQGVDAREYFAPKSGEDLEGYREKYAELAAKVNEMAHKEKGSHA